jgi:23S rRNA (pseudouridine1915-N3)-methyltransferase
MKVHIATIGQPKLAFARMGWDEYIRRLGRLHTVRTTHIADRYADDGSKILLATATKQTTLVALDVAGQQYTSQSLAAFLQTRQLEGKELCFIIGGPNGLPGTIQQAADYRWSLSLLTLPHDLAMVVTLEALYRASMITMGLPYHR